MEAQAFAPAADPVAEVGAIQGPEGEPVPEDERGGLVEALEIDHAAARERGFLRLSTMDESAWDPALRALTDVGTMSVTGIGPVGGEEAASGPEEAPRLPLDAIARPEIPANEGRHRCRGRVWVY